MSFTVEQIARRLGLEEPTTYQQKRVNFLANYGGALRRYGRTTGMLLEALEALSQGKRAVVVASLHREAERLYQTTLGWAQKLFGGLASSSTQLRISLEGTSWTRQTAHRIGGEILFCSANETEQRLRGQRFDRQFSDYMNPSPSHHCHRVDKDSRQCLGCGKWLRGKELTTARYRRALSRENPDMIEYVRMYDRCPT